MLWQKVSVVFQQVQRNDKDKVPCATRPVNVFYGKEIIFLELYHVVPLSS